jgi:hypothetical protein
MKRHWNSGIAAALLAVLVAARAGSAQGPIDALRAPTWPVPLTAPAGETAAYSVAGHEWRGHVTVLKARDNGATTLPTGQLQVQSFFDVFTELTLPDSSTTLLQGPGYARFIQVPGTDTFDTEMLSMGLIGGGPFMIRESPTRASLGRTSVVPDGGGYRIDSFFDIFTELSVDGGQTWAPSTPPNSPLHVQTPEPSTVALLVAGGAGLLLWSGRALRRRRA